ncbi:MAG: GNAT family N-acetyltransferase [Muriicola sp.]|nr:GNAT family N-acetyltransferase [Muriicola sp.]
MILKAMAVEDWPSVAKIYQEGIATGFATFELEVPTYEQWDKAHLTSCRLVALHNQTIVGWAALSPVSNRCVYGGVAEVSVYVAMAHRGKGLGEKLLDKLVQESEKAGLWTLQSGIFPENLGSIQIHKKTGFRLIGKRERIGKLHGEWKDNLIFERRSNNVGID